jgi:endogenous inhibitor of DNA gyrase (YacG/DUF329 family)
MPADPSTDHEADWRAERACPICWTTFTPAGPRHRYCSDRCRKHAHLRRQAEPAVENQGREPESTPAPIAVRACPHCGGEVSVVALLTTPEAARPAVPDPGVIPLRRA